MTVTFHRPPCERGRIAPEIACAAWLATRGRDQGGRYGGHEPKDYACARRCGDARTRLTKVSRGRHYGPNEGKEKAPGVRQVDLGQREAIIPGYKTVSMRDIVVQPGAVIPKDTMPNAMVCHITEGGLRVMQNDTEFRVKKGDVWTCTTGTTEQAWNEGDGVAVMRITDLLSA